MSGTSRCPLDQPDRKATSFVTSHFYLDDFAQSSEDPNPEDGFRTPAEATTRGWRGGVKGFVEDDLAGDPEAGALASNGQGCRRRAGGSGPHRRRGRSRAGLPLSAAQDAADYVRLNVLPRPGQAQPPPQIMAGPVMRAPPRRGGAARAGGGAWRGGR